MSMKQILRCAIYTRKSSEEGLEQDFNSLHAQREACEAYIASQRHEGWILHPAEYDDGGFSGGNMQRPALKQLMDDIVAHKINVVVVYKVDRLTRSLADFAKIVEHFDAQGISFVSVTQQFNTTSSMGRLTLNVLLSFAQFEREVTGERIRDKIAASKKKGIWMGGPLPLGYDVVDRKLIINEPEAHIVRMMYRRYLELGCVLKLQKEMIKQNINGKKSARTQSSFMGRGALYKLLSNPIYISQIRHKNICYPGQHQPIIDQELWDNVQNIQKTNSVTRYRRSDKTAHSLLIGKLFDASGEKLSPSHSVRNGRRYRYYVSRALLAGTTDKTSHSWRLPAQEIELTVIQAAKSILNDRNAVAAIFPASGTAAHDISSLLHAASEVGKQLDSNTNARDIFDKFIRRVEIRQDGIRLTISLASLVAQDMDREQIPMITHDIPLQMKRRGHEMRLVIEGRGAFNIKADPVLIKTIARAHVWSQELLSGQIPSMTEIASRCDVSVSYVKKLIKLAFLAPDIVKAIIAGEQPVHLTTQMLIRQIDIPLDWEEQKRVLGF